MKMQLYKIIFVIIFLTANMAFGQPSSGKVQITDGAENATVRDTGSADSLNVAITDGSGNQITSFGGGTEYTEDAAAASDPVGNATILVRKDTPATIASADGDNVAQRGTNYGAAYVQILDSSGNYINSFGGGTQYTEGDTDATITGTACMWEDASNTLVSVSAAKPLPISDAGGSLTVDGTVAATQSGTWTNRITDGTNTVSVRDTGSSDSANVAIVDASGNQITSFGGGTEYTEDAASAADPVGNVGLAIRADSLSGITSADGDNIAYRATNKGELYVKHVDTLACTQSGTWDEIGINDSGNSITVDGTVAATQSGTWNVTNVSGTVSLPTGASTSANQSTEITSLQLLDDVVGTDGLTLGNKFYQIGGNDGTDYRALSTNASGHVNIADGGNSITIDGSVGQSGTWTVQPGNTANTTPWLASIHDGTNKASVRDTGSSDSLNVSIVDGSGTQITSFGGGTQYTEDVASASDPVGNQILGRRRDSLSGTEVSADGDNIAFNATSKGELYVKQTDAVACTQSGTWDEVGINDSGNSITVDGTVAATQSGTWNVTNVSGTVSLPTGASTAANQSTTNSSLTSILSSIDSIYASIRAEDSATSSAHNVFPMGVKRQDTLATDTSADGDYAIAKVTADGELYIKSADPIDAVLDSTQYSSYQSQLDGINTSVGTVSTNITNSQKAEDAATASGNTLTMIGMKRQDTLSTDTSADLDASFFKATSKGELYVKQSDDINGTIADGASSAIKATVLDYTNSNPLAVRLTDTAGDYIAAGAGTQYTEDVASAADPIGTMLIARRRDSTSSEVSANGDNIAINATSNGELRVFDEGNSLNLQFLFNPLVADDAAFTPATTYVNMAGFTFDDTSPDTVNEGDAGAARMSANRNLYSTIRDAAGNERGVNVNASNQMSVSVDNTVTVASHAVTNAGTFAVQASSAGDVAHDTADSGNPIKIGHKAVVFGATPTEVTADDRTTSYASRAGIPFVQTGHMNAKVATENITDANGAQTNTALVTVSAGTKIIVTGYKVKCDQDNTNDYDFRMGFGTANTPALDNDGSLIADDPGIAPGSGVVSGPIFAIGADDEDLRFDMEDPAGGACSVTAYYFTTSS